MSKIREAFVERFGEDQALLIEIAASEHCASLPHSEPGHESDRFQNALLICIGHECWTHPDYAKHHGFKEPGSIDAWVIEHGDLANYKGEPPDYTSFYLGRYNKYVGVAPMQKQSNEVEQPDFEAIAQRIAMTGQFEDSEEERVRKLTDGINDVLDAVVGFLTSPVDLPKAPEDIVIGQIWWEERNGWKYPWRMTGPKEGYPCGEPVEVSDE